MSDTTLELLKEAVKKINHIIIIVIIIPGMFLSISFFEMFCSELNQLQVNFIPYFLIVLFFVFALVLGWTTHYIALVFYSIFVGKVLKKTKDGQYPPNMGIYRDFFANLSLTFPLFLWITSDNNYLIGLISFFFYFWIASAIYIQCENAKVLSNKIEKSFGWDEKSIKQNYYTLEALKIISLDLLKHVKEITTKK